MSMEKVRALVGDITEEQIASIDQFLGERMGLFIPAVGQCGYALSKDHTHPAYSFVFTMDNNLQVGGGDASLETVGQRVLIGMSPDFRHHEEPSEEFARYYAIMIERELYNEVLQSLNVQPDPQYHFTVAPGQNENLLALLRSYMIETRRPATRPLKVAALETVIAYCIAESFHTPPQERTGELHFRVELDRAIEFIHRSLAAKLTVELIAREACVSPSHLSRLFREQINSTVMGYVTEVRLQNARKLLLIGERSVTDIAALCGFSSPSHFAATFRNRYDMTPRELIAKAQ